MQVKLRLQRYGTKGRPFYRIVAISSTVKRDGKFLEILGLYHPISPKDKQVRLEKERIQHWLTEGAEPSDTVRNLLTKAGLWKDHAIAREGRIAAKNKVKNARRKAKATKV